MDRRTVVPVVRAVAGALSLVAGARIDERFGDPPNRAHPVALLGRALRTIERGTPATPGEQRRFGLLVAALTPAASAGSAAFLTRLADRMPGGGAAASSALLALATSQRTLYDRAAEVAAALERDDLPAAQHLLATHLVSRNTSALDASEVAAATIESVAENLSDGVIGAWWWYAFAGAPGAWAYRASNTLDAMWGYRRPPYGDLGRAAARTDDWLNLIPARLTAWAILAAAGGHGAATWWRDRGLTESPNAGHPMAAMAGALDVVLMKTDAYTLGAGGRAPGPGDIRRAIAISRQAARLTLAVLAGFAAWWRWQWQA